jgi:hypothetical protein
LPLVSASGRYRPPDSPLAAVGDGEPAPLEPLSSVAAENYGDNRLADSPLAMLAERRACATSYPHRTIRDFPSERRSMKKAIWLSYDLGVRGDYEGLYTWLDEHGAKECGDNLAFVNYDYQTDMLSELKSELVEAIAPSKRTRIYTIHLDPATKKMKGAFLMGGRKAPPWAGFAAGIPEEDDGA